MTKLYKYLPKLYIFLVDEGQDPVQQAELMLRLLSISDNVTPDQIKLIDDNVVIPGHIPEA